MMYQMLLPDWLNGERKKMHYYLKILHEMGFKLTFLQQHGVIRGLSVAPADEYPARGIRPNEKSFLHLVRQSNTSISHGALIHARSLCTSSKA